MAKVKADPYPVVKVEEKILDYWIANEIGGSGLSVGIQKMLRDMAIEIREHRTTLRPYDPPVSG
jgi:hypothetical protein